MISIYHYADAKSDKIWAIDMDINSNGSYSIFYGKRTNKLRHEEIHTNDPMKNALEKIRKGYGAVTGSIVNGKYQELIIPTSDIGNEQTIEVAEIPKALFDFSKLKLDDSAFF